MIEFLNVYDRTITNGKLKKTAVLQNAFDITETQELNAIYTLKFSLPSDDMKNQFCEPFAFVRWKDDGQLYRIVKITKAESDTGTIAYECEHAITTLCDSIIFSWTAYGGGTIKTADVISWLLDQQKTKHWVLDECDFARRFEYGWEQENLLNALYSIPKEFTATYKWAFDTSAYPWKISLKQIDPNAKPEYYIRAKRNLVEMNSTETDSEICTRLYLLGYGEGINQLTIKEINNGVPYLQAPASVIAKYGLIEKVLVDRRFENAESLKEYGQTVLDGLQSPSYSRSFDVVDLYPLTNQDIDSAEPGKLCKLTMDNTVVYITKTTRRLDEKGSLQIELSNKATDVVSAIADLADRVRIESVYAQGATQIYQHSKDANATKDKGMELNLYFPSEMKQINKVLLKVQLEAFRSYSAATESNAAVSDTTEAGGQQGSTLSSQAGEYSTSSGSVRFSGTLGGEVTAWNGRVEPSTWPATRPVYESGGNYWVDIPELAVKGFSLYHSHNFNVDLAQLGDHSHLIHIPSHSHAFNIGSHKHKFTVPAHTHAIKPGIYEYGRASKFDIYIEGVKKKTVNASYCEENITSLLLGANKQIPRDTWIKLEIRPNDLAYVVSSVFVQGFVQSRGGGNY